ncbi:hypothetical protein A3C86_03985, partial [Candidatus Kaiserbacteria bacterium RIFCSPHIGHO2_02_FULL_49_16]
MLAVPAMSMAAEFRAGDQPSVRADEKILNDLYISGSSITSAGNISGDILAAGGTIVVSGNVGADVIAGGGNVTILSAIADDVRVGAGNILIQGKVGGDAILGGGEVLIGGPGVGGDVIVGGGIIRVDAPVKGSVRIGGGQVYINAPIKGNVQIDADEVTLGSATVISGNLTYKAKKEAVMEEGAVVMGKVEFTERSKRGISTAALGAIFSVLVLGKFLTLFIGALLIGLVFRRLSTDIVARTVERPLLELGRGLAVFVALPLLSILLLASFVGAPLGILGFIGFAALLLFAWIITPIIVGSIAYKYLSKRELEVSWKTILFGTFIYQILGIVPVVGNLAQFLLILLTIGVMSAFKWDE